MQGRHRVAIGGGISRSAAWKSFGILPRAFMQGFTLGTTGLDRFIAFDKDDVIGRDKALAEKQAGGAARLLVTIEVDATDADASGYEPIWTDGTLVGHVTSGGYGHTLGKSLALALVDHGFATPGTELTTHVVGQERAARMTGNAPYDPSGALMRGEGGVGRALHVTPANADDRAEVGRLAQAVQAATGDSVELGYVDQGYTGQRPAEAAQAHGIALEVIKLSEAKRGFVLLPRRWVVERSFAWAARFRRLARDYERLSTTLAGLHVVAFATLMLNKATALFDLVRNTL